MASVAEPLTPEMLRGWYHSIELQPGVITQGRSTLDLCNISLVRKIFRQISIEGARCLDIGTMDGLISVLLHRRHAQTIIACDRYNRRARIDIVRRFLGLDLTYLSGVTLTETRRIVPHLIDGPFDLIVFSGVLYHMYDPMTGLALVRSMLRPGGIAVIETAAFLSNRPVDYFNVAGRNNADSQNYWMMSLSLLDYLLRFFRLKPLDCAFLDAQGAQAEDGSKALRVCIACEAVADSLAEPSDRFMSVTPEREDAAEFPDWLPPCENRSLGYQTTSEDLIKRASGAVDIYQTVRTGSPVAFSVDDVRLLLDARY